MEQIDRLGLRDTLTSLKQPVLGICVGMQLLFEHSEEEDTPCLGLLSGRVRKLTPERDMPVPHMGWSRLKVGDESMGLANGDYVYFAHSFACDDGPHSIATARYGREIAAAARHLNYWGVQFHPERSAEAGANFLRSFLDQTC
jgi:glutamine amidotransferase